MTAYVVHALSQALRAWNVSVGVVTDDQVTVNVPVDCRTSLGGQPPFDVVANASAIARVESPGPGRTTDAIDDVQRQLDEQTSVLARGALLKQALTATGPEGGRQRFLTSGLVSNLGPIRLEGALRPSKLVIVPPVGAHLSIAVVTVAERLSTCMTYSRRVFTDQEAALFMTLLHEELGRACNGR